MKKEESRQASLSGKRKLAWFGVGLVMLVLAFVIVKSEVAGADTNHDARIAYLESKMAEKDRQIMYLSKRSGELNADLYRTKVMAWNNNNKLWGHLRWSGLE